MYVCKSAIYWWDIGWCRYLTGVGNDLVLNTTYGGRRQLFACALKSAYITGHYSKWIVISFYISQSAATKGHNAHINISSSLSQTSKTRIIPSISSAQTKQNTGKRFSRLSVWRLCARLIDGLTRTDTLYEFEYRRIHHKRWDLIEHFSRADTKPRRESTGDDVITELWQWWAHGTITIYRAFFYFAHMLIRGLHLLLSAGKPATD